MKTRRAVLVPIREEYSACSKQTRSQSRKKRSRESILIQRRRSRVFLKWDASRRNIFNNSRIPRTKGLATVITTDYSCKANPLRIGGVLWIKNITNNRSWIIVKRMKLRRMYCFRKRKRKTERYRNWRKRLLESLWEHWRAWKLVICFSNATRDISISPKTLRNMWMRMNYMIS